MTLWWTLKAWPWLKKHWKWFVLFPAMLVVWLAGRRSGEVTVVDKREESDGARERKEELEAKADKAKDEARKEARRRTQEVMTKHLETVEKLDKEQRAKVNDLIDDPEELNSFLLQVGKDMRK